MSKPINNTAIKVLVIIFVLFFTIVAGYEYFQYGSIFHNTEHFRKIYSEALEHKNNEEYAQAFSSLEKISPRYEAYDAVLYQQAQCAAKTGDEASVQKRLKSLISKYPDSYLFIPAKYDLAKSYLRSGNKDAATNTFQNIINTHKNTDYEIGSYYYLVDLTAIKNSENAIKYLKKYVERSQDGRFSLECANRLANSETSNLSENDNYFIGLIYFNNQKYDETIKFLKAAKPDKAWYYLAKTYIAKKNYPEAKNYIKLGLKNYSSNFSSEDLDNIIYAYVNISSSEKQAWEELKSLNSKNPNVEDTILFNRAKFLPAEHAIATYRTIVELHSKGDYAAESLKKLFWYEYNLKNYKIAKELASKHVSSYSHTKSAPEMNYWLGKIYEKDDNKNLAIKMYTRILEKYPDDYYAMRAYGRIHYLTKGKDYGWDFKLKGRIDAEDFELGLPYSYNEIKTKFGATLAELLLVEDFTTIEYFNGFKEPFIESWIAYKKGLRSTSTTTARNAMEEFTEKPDKSDIKWQFVYPCYFVDAINKYSIRNKISPYMLIALIREESYFNPLALSPSNAVGLTQILPSTAKEVSERKGYGRINEFLLFNPETNIKYGAAYFAQIKKQVKNENVYAVAAYNGGAGAVSSWLKHSKYIDTDEFIENIPYPETKNYVKKVFRSYWNYVRLYMN